MMHRSSLAIDFFDKKTDHQFHLPVSLFKKPGNDKEYVKLEKILDQITDVVRNDHKHPLAVVMQIIGENLEQYDDEHHPPIGANISGIDMIKYLMEKEDLTQNDLADIFGSQANVSKYLHGERGLSMNQIIKLKIRFGLSADFFLKN